MESCEKKFLKSSLSVYARFIARHSYLVLLFVGVISTTLTVVPLVCHDLPSFSDPLVGFETRGTTLAHRFIAWENLIDETRPSRRLAVNPEEIEEQIRMNQTYFNTTRQHIPQSSHSRSSKRKINNNPGMKKTSFNAPESNISNGHVHWGYRKNITFEDENAAFTKDHTRKQWVSLNEMRRKPIKPEHTNYASVSCGPPVSNYAHLVITSSDNTSLLTFENVEKMCRLQRFLVEVGSSQYYKLCERSMHAEELCCPMWSLPNYIALMSGKSSCENLTRDDVNKSVNIIRKCAGYFHNFTLMSSCGLGQCKVPSYCSQYDAVYNLLFYLIDSDAFSPDDYSQSFVKNAMIFLPLPYSTSSLPYYLKLQKSNLSYDSLVIPAIDFGLKNALFDELIIQETWLMALGGVFVFIGVWFYTKSLFLTLLLFTAKAYSLGIAYFLYVYVFNLEFFPFMNLLVVVVVIGIGADDAFLYVKIWNGVSKQFGADDAFLYVKICNFRVKVSKQLIIDYVPSASATIMVPILEKTLKHSMCITTLTTAVAFFASYVSDIPAINCFSVFAGTTVLVNFFLMIICLPASVYIIHFKLCTCKIKVLSILQKRITEIWEDIIVVLNRFIITCVIKLHIVCVIILGAIGIGSIFVVFYSPGLQLPESRQFQLFQTSHPIEQYETQYRDKFLFERFSKDIGTGSKMPLRWIWGIKAVDNGNYMDPYSTGHLIFDENFSVSEPASQIWLLNFCAKLKSQSFYQPTLSPLFPNCFIETFKMFMSRPCTFGRAPCCESSPFPFKKEVFDLCIIEAMKTLYMTPRAAFIPGVAGPKFLRSASPKVAAAVVEFESVVPYSMSYTSMNDFFLHVENWTRTELKLAPTGMSGGWFLSDLQFYDLQRTLASGTVISLFLSASLGIVVLGLATKNFIVTICALTAMIFSSTATIAILVLSDWKLNVLESVAISTSAGLAVNFSLHYALSYTKASGNKSARVKYALSASAGPTAAAALTTGFAGIFLLKSNLLPYVQIGTFLALIMSVSWIYATFFLCSLLQLFGKPLTKESPAEEQVSVPRIWHELFAIFLLFRYSSHNYYDFDNIYSFQCECREEIDSDYWVCCIYDIGYMDRLLYMTTDHFGHDSWRHHF